MQLRVDIFRAIAAVLFGAAFLAPSARACERLWVADRELWIDDGVQARLVVSDGRGIFHPRWSATGEHIAYAHDFRFDNGVRSEVVIVDDQGRTLRTFSIPAESEVNAILLIGWRSEQRVFAIGHINPSTSKYLEWDVTSGRLVDEKSGSWFAVSPDGRFVAQRAHVPHGTPAPYDSAMLMINGKVVYPPSGDSVYHRFAGGLAWSADSRQLALLDRAGSTTELVVITSGGEEIKRAPLPETIAPSELWWKTDAIFIRGDGETWRVDPSTGKSEKTIQLPKASQRALPPQSLKDRGTTARPEDVRCAQ